MRVLATPDHRPVYLETPSVSSTPAGTVLIGYPAYFWRSAQVLASSGDDLLRQALRDRSAGAIIRRDGSVAPIRLPVGVDAPIALRGTNTGTGRIDVLWGSVPDSTFVGAGMAARTIWEAETNGVVWSHQSSVIELERIFWNATQPIVIGTPNGLEVAVPAYGRDHDVWHSGVVVLVKEGSRWSHGWIETGLPPAYVSLVVDSRKAAVLVFIGGTASPKAAMPYGIYVARRRGDEMTWDTPRLVLPLGARGLAWFPTVLRMKSGTMHLLWADQPAAARNAPPAVHHMISSDAASTWAPAPALTMPADIDVMRAELLGSETIVVVARLAMSGRLVTATWTGAGWSALDQSFAEPAISVPTLGTGKANELVLTWGVARAGAITSEPAFPAPALAYARRSAVCPKSRS